MNVLKKTAILSILAISMNVSALSVEDALSKDAKTITGNYEELIGASFTNKQKLKIYDKVFKTYAEAGKNWGLKSVSHNAELELGLSLKDNNVQVVEYSMSYEDRTMFITLNYFQKESKILYVIKEILPVSTAELLEGYDKTREDEEYTQVYDESRYSMFQKNDYSNYTNYHVNKGNSVAIYTLSNIIDL